MAPALSRPVLSEAVPAQGLSYSQEAREDGVSRALVRMLHHRWLLEVEAAYESRSRRPRDEPADTSHRTTLAAYTLNPAHGYQRKNG